MIKFKIGILFHFIWLKLDEFWHKRKGCIMVDGEWLYPMEVEGELVYKIEYYEQVLNKPHWEFYHELLMISEEEFCKRYGIKKYEEEKTKTLNKNKYNNKL